MVVKDILRLGNPTLLERSEASAEDELEHIRGVVADLHDTLMDFRRRFDYGRAIAAPQINVLKRLVYMNIGTPSVFINPVLDQMSEEMMELWDDCMSFPDLLVRVRRHRTCRITFRDENWVEQQMDLEGDLSELLQHEVDHLDGILATERAIDGQSFALRSERHTLR